MKYYQAVYQTDALEYLCQLSKIMDGEDWSFMYRSWVTELFVDTP